MGALAAASRRCRTGPCRFDSAIRFGRCTQPVGFWHKIFQTSRPRASRDGISGLGDGHGRSPVIRTSGRPDARPVASVADRLSGTASPFDAVGRPSWAGDRRPKEALQRTLAGLLIRGGSARYTDNPPQHGLRRPGNEIRTRRPPKDIPCCPADRTLSHGGCPCARWLGSRAQRCRDGDNGPRRSRAAAVPPAAAWQVA